MLTYFVRGSIIIPTADLQFVCFGFSSIATKAFATWGSIIVPTSDLQFACFGFSSIATKALATY